MGGVMGRLGGVGIILWLGHIIMEGLRFVSKVA